MARDESLKNAQKRYAKAAIKQIVVKFSPQDHDLYEYVKSHDSMAAYVRKVLRADMERNQNA